MSRLALLVVIGALVAPATTAAATRTYLTYSRVGGIAGMRDHLTIATNRHVARSNRGAKTKHFVMSSKAFTSLKRAVANANIPSLKSSYGPPNGVIVSDGVAITIHVSGRTITVETGAQEVPAGLEALLEKLGKLAE